MPGSLSFSRYLNVVSSGVDTVVRLGTYTLSGMLRLVVVVEPYATRLNTAAMLFSRLKLPPRDSPTPSPNGAPPPPPPAGPAALSPLASSRTAQQLGWSRSSGSRIVVLINTRRERRGVLTRTFLTVSGRSWGRCVRRRRPDLRVELLAVLLG
uniref:(northern house mosquito) hypothetical protein n=1 Tax=Culex pipiens TaxID=7175 RepID=A0A8D8I1N4_CULPI